MIVSVSIEESMVWEKPFDIYYTSLEADTAT